MSAKVNCMAEWEIFSTMPLEISAKNMPIKKRTATETA